MELTKEQIEQEIAELEALCLQHNENVRQRQAEIQEQQARFLVESNMQAGILNGELQVYRSLLSREAEVSRDQESRAPTQESREDTRDSPDGTPQEDTTDKLSAPLSLDSATTQP